jgi:hypothetical protein
MTLQVGGEADSSHEKLAPIAARIIAAATNARQALRVRYLGALEQANCGSDR